MKRFEQKDLFSIFTDNKNDDTNNQINPSLELSFDKLKEKCTACNKCELRKGCKQVVFGDGSPEALIMLVGEAPGSDEDNQGIPFVGSAGQLLNRILSAVNIKREEVYITNIVKCRPPRNRLPTNEEINHCLPYLKKQIEIINPDIIVCLGSLSTRTLIDKNARITKVRGNWYHIHSKLYIPTFHPAALLRDVHKKRPVWEDFQSISEEYGNLLSKSKEREFYE